MAEDTAVLERAGTAEEQVAPPQEAAPETVTETLSPETDAPGTPETQDATPPDPLAELADDDLKQHPKVKELVEAEMRANEARWRESERRKAEAAARAYQYDQRLTQATNLARQEALPRIGGALKAIEDGQVDAQTAWRSLAPLIDDVANAVAVEQIDLFRGVAEDFIAAKLPNYRIPQDVAAYVTSAWHSRNPNAMADALFTMFARAGTEAALPRLKAETEAAYAKRAAEAQKTQQIKDAQANRPDGPTAGLPAAGGGLPGQFKSVREADKAISDGKWDPSSRDEYNARVAGLPY